MKIIGIIPARYASNRFPGKPLVDIKGLPMVWRVYLQAKKVSLFDEVYVATDDERIFTAIESRGGKAIMTSDRHPTGTDRVAEVAEHVKADWYVNVQGDEPLIEPETIQSVFIPIQNNKDMQVVNLMSKITDPVDAVNPTIPKVITSADNRGVFLTRSLAPFPKGHLDYIYYKQLGVYAFTPEALAFYKNAPQGKIECIEEIEILRFIESGWHVQYVEAVTESIAVDTPKDLQRILKILEQEK